MVDPFMRLDSKFPPLDYFINTNCECFYIKEEHRNRGGVVGYWGNCDRSEMAALTDSIK